MQKIFKNGRVALPQQTELAQVDIVVRNGKIEALKPDAQGGFDDYSVIDLAGKTVVPGFIDVHTHGGNGVDLNKATMAEIKKLAEFYASCGVSTFIASILTDTVEQTLHCINLLYEYSLTQKSGAELVGIHLEGPFLSPQFKGAQPGELIKSGDFDLLEQYQEAAHGLIKQITIAPEEGENLELIRRAKQELNIISAIGHSNATFAEAKAAIANGAQSATHLWNAMRPVHQHEQGIVGACLMSDIHVETILDGLHLAPDTVNFIAKNKGLDKMVAVTDSIMAAGYPDGEYTLGINKVFVKAGDARLADGVRAGSTLTMDKAFRNAVKFLAISPAQAAPLTATNAATLFSLNDRGSLAVGKRADFAILDDNLQVVATYVAGEERYQA